MIIDHQEVLEAKSQNNGNGFQPKHNTPPNFPHFPSQSLENGLIQQQKLLQMKGCLNNYLIIHCDYMGILKIALDHFQRKVQTEEYTGSTLV